MPAGESPLSVAALSDALDRLGIEGQARGIVSVTPGGRLTGPAFTVRLAPVTGRPGTVGDYLDDVPPGHVVVLDNGGLGDVTVWGGILTLVARERGLAGTVIHGVCRDSDDIGKAGYPVFSRGRHMRTGKGRVRVAAVGETVSLGRASVEPGDRVVGDGDGVVVIPAERVDEVLEAAREIEAAESSILEAVREGRPLAEARRVVGYHELQSRR